MRTPATEKIKRAMAARGMGFEDLALAVGLKPRSLVNILNGSSRSRISQQAITNFCRIKIWPGLEVTERIVSLPDRTVIILPDDNSTLRFMQEAGAASYGVSANVITLQCATELRFHLVDEKFPSSAQNPRNCPP
jgi:transcriptional regulator with XRE-family HTH domain